MESRSGCGHLLTSVRDPRTRVSQGGNNDGMESRTDAEVIACSCASPAAFGELFDRHGTTLFRYFVRRVGPEDADSLLGELFGIAFEKREGYDTDRAEARPWLYGIANNLVARHRQREARRLA